MESQDSKVASFSVPKNEGEFTDSTTAGTWSVTTDENTSTKIMKMKIKLQRLLIQLKNLRMTQ